MAEAFKKYFLFLIIWGTQPELSAQEAFDPPAETQIDPEIAALIELLKEPEDRGQNSTLDSQGASGDGSFTLPEFVVTAQAIEKEEVRPPRLTPLVELPPPPLPVAEAPPTPSLPNEGVPPLLRFQGISSSTLEGVGLQKKLRASLGETLAAEPGVTASSYSPGASRPIIRGFEGVRVLTLLDGLNSMDLSADSPDHGVLVEPLFASAITIHRGPASLLYGNSAIGGVVDTRTRFIPEREDNDYLRFLGSQGYDSQGNGWHTANSLSWQKGNMAFTASYSQRQAGDISIPGQARTAEYDELFQPRVAVPGGVEEAVPNPSGTLPNTGHQSTAASVGLRLDSTDSVSLGLAFSRFTSEYGVPYFFPGDSTDFFGNTTIAAELERGDARLSFEPTNGFGLFRMAQFSFGYGNYEHDESFSGLEKDEGTNFVETSFKKQTTEARFDLFNGSPQDWLEGVMGVHYFTDRLEASRLLLPPPNPFRLNSTLRNENLGLFIKQKAHLGDFTLEAGSRREATIASLEEPGSPESTSQDSSLSHSLSLSYQREDTPLFNHFELALTGSLTKRLPTANERYALWENAALGRFLIGGDLDGIPLSPEESQGVELALRTTRGRDDLSFTFFYYDFSNYIFLEDQRNSFINTAAYVEAPARFHGFEADWTHHFFEPKENEPSLDFTLMGDFIRSRNLDRDHPIPRMPAARIGGELSFHSSHWDLFFEARHNFEVSNIAISPTPELATDSYTMVNAGIIYRPFDNPESLQISLRLNNLLDAEARNHTSFRKDTAPLPGFGTSVDLRYQF